MEGIVYSNVPLIRFSSSPIFSATKETISAFGMSVVRFSVAVSLPYLLDMSISKT